MRISRKLAACSNPARMRMIKIMREKPVTFSEIKLEVNLSDSSVKEHMRALKNAGLLNSEYSTHFITYTINDDELKEVVPFCLYRETE